MLKLQDTERMHGHGKERMIESGTGVHAVFSKRAIILPLVQQMLQRSACILQVISNVQLSKGRRWTSRIKRIA